MRRFITRRDIVIIAVLLVVCAGVLFLLHGVTNVGAVAEVAYDGEVVERIPLNRDGIYHISGRLEVTLEVSAGRVRFVNSLCPDHICENEGWLRDEYDCAVCMPALVTVTVR